MLSFIFQVALTIAAYEAAKWAWRKYGVTARLKKLLAKIGVDL